MSAESSRSQRIDAYAAGLIDGEGCIGATAAKRTVGIRVDVGMTTKAQEVLYLLQQEYGGRVGSFREATDRWEKALAWRLFGTEAAAFLRRIQPHLILKREQVHLALLIEETRQALPKSTTGQRSDWTEEAFERCMTLYRRIKELNRKGPAIKTPPAPPGSQMVAQLVAGAWVVPQTDLFSELGSAPFSGTWPKRGSMRSGACFELPMWVPATGEPGCSSLLPTPVVNDMGERKTPERWDEWTAEMQDRHRNGNGHGRSLAIEAQRLLPTPRTSDTNGPGTHGDGGMDLRTAVTMLPTPTVGDSKSARNSTANRHKLPPTGIHAGDTLTDWATLHGASTSPPSVVTNGPSVDQPRDLLTMLDD